MIVAIIGSRGWPDPEMIWNYVRDLPEGTVVVTGGWWDGPRIRPTQGADMIAATAAQCRGLVVVVVAGSPRRGKYAGLQRNPVVVQMADKVAAFHDGESPGTLGTIDLARQIGKPVEVYL